MHRLKVNILYSGFLEILVNLHERTLKCKIKKIDIKPQVNNV